jgi:hypothetical protein
MADRHQEPLPGLDISEVEIRTRSITWHEVRRGLNLTKFRQLLPEPLVDVETAELRGEPWFLVYYDPKLKAEVSDQRHFAVRFGDELRRSVVQIVHLEGQPSDRGRSCEQDWPAPLHAMRARHERLSFYAFIDRAMQGDAALPRGFNHSHRDLAFAERPPFAAFSASADQELASGLVGITDPEPDLTLLVARFRLPSASEHQRECREILRQYLAARGITAGNSPEYWESLIEGNAEAARRYIERWNALMDDLLAVPHLIL